MTSKHEIDLSEYFGLVHYWAKKMYMKLLSAGVEKFDQSDLLQAGFEGLVKAGSSYDPSKKTKFSTYASSKINWEIIDYLRTKDPLSQQERLQVKELAAARKKLTIILGREPHVGELAKVLKVSEDEIRKIISSEITILSMDSAEESDNPGAIQIPDVSVETEEKVIAKGLAADTADCLETTLSAGEKRILLFRFFHEMTLVEVAELEKVSKDTVRRRQIAAAGKMRTCLENKGWQLTDIMEIRVEGMPFDPKKTGTMSKSTKEINHE